LIAFQTFTHVSRSFYIGSRTECRIRIDVDQSPAFGTGKIRLLESIQETGNVAKSARALGMSVNKAWLLIHQMNQLLAAPVIYHNTTSSTRDVLTDTGFKLIEVYRQMEAQVQQAAESGIGVLNSLLKSKQQ
jgi:molybdate transport system regulatory protein